MTLRGFSFFIVLMGFLPACTTAPKPDYSTFFENQPRSILVLPPFNQTTGVEAPIVFSTTVSRPFAERGYYIFPVHLAQDILNDLGLTDEGLIKSVPPQQFKEVFGADAILYITIIDWATQYIVLASNVTVTAEYKLVDAISGDVLWERTERAVHQSGGGGGGGGGLVGSLVTMAVNAAITAAVVDYRPLAMQANNQAANRAGQGLPAGPYHPKFQKDLEDYK